jgi:hypothetical protein
VIRNSFRNDKIDLEGIELAQITEQICRRFAQIAFFAQLPDGDKLQGSAVSNRRGDLEIALP